MEMTQETLRIALDALTDAMQWQQRLCAKGLIDERHNHNLLRKLQHAIKVCESEYLPPVVVRFDPHRNCVPGAPCSTACTGGLS